MPRSAPQHPLRVVVLGGGACGMAAAWRLAEAGATVTIIEREPRPGGLCGTHERDGFRFDFGGHRFITQSPALDEIIRRLVGDDLLTRRRSSVILNGGQKYRYPLELDDVLPRFGLRRGLRATASYARERLRAGTWLERPDRNFEDWVVQRFGRDLYDTFFGPYTEKLWGIDPKTISADWAAQRISLLSLTDVLVRLAGLRHGGARTYARRYLYPRLGIGQIFERLAGELHGLGARLHLGAEVRGLDVSKGRIRAVRFSDGSDEHEVPCDAVVSTIALPELAHMVAPRLPSAVDASARALRFRAIRLLNVMLRGPEVSPHTWMYVSEPRYLPARIQEPRHRSPEMAPPGHTSLMLEIPCAVDDEVWSASEDALFARCSADLEGLGIRGIPERTLGYFSTYVRAGYPIYHLSYDDDRRRVLGYLEETRNLVSCGRQGGFRYIFMDTAMEMGFAAASALLGRSSSQAIAEIGADQRDLLEMRALTA